MTTPSSRTHTPRAASVDVVLPCLDEAEALPWVLERIPPGWRALVVDNGSTDGSAGIAKALGATVVREERRGFGAACHAGLTAATADIVCFCDCDATLDPGDLVPFVQRIAADEADLVLGRRRPRTRGAWPLHARVGNLAVTRLLHRRTGLRLHDLGPLRAARREPLLTLTLTDRRSGYPLQMLVHAADAGWRITEYDVPYHPRTGASKVTGTWRGTWQAVRDMSRVLGEGGAGERPGAEAPGAGSTGAGSEGPELEGAAPGGREGHEGVAVVRAESEGPEPDASDSGRREGSGVGVASCAEEDAPEREGAEPGTREGPGVAVAGRAEPEAERVDRSGARSGNSVRKGTRP